MKKKMVLFDIDYTLFNTATFKKTKLQKHTAYNEVENVLEQLLKIASLGIFSEGELEFQKSKLIKTNIQKYFLKRHTHIVEKKDAILRSLLLKYKNKKLFLVDDKLTILHKAKRIMPSVFTIWVKRGIYAKSQKPIENFTPNAIIKNLKELTSTVALSA